MPVSFGFEDMPAKELNAYIADLTKRAKAAEKLVADVRASAIALGWDDSNSLSPLTWLVQRVKRVAEMDLVIHKLLEVLPDAFHDANGWHQCWNALSAAAQDEVKTARYAAGMVVVQGTCGGA